MVTLHVEHVDTRPFRERGDTGLTLRQQSCNVSLIVIAMRSGPQAALVGIAADCSSLILDAQPEGALPVIRVLLSRNSGANYSNCE
jgi:hypothetical protein